MVNELEEIRDMVIDLRDRANVILVVIEATLGVADANDFPPPGGTFEVDETSVSIAPMPTVPDGFDVENTHRLPVEHCPRIDQHPPHDWASDAITSGLFCPGMPF